MAQVSSTIESPTPKSSPLLASRLERLNPPEGLVIIITAIVVGVGTGLGAVAFIYSLRGMAELARSIREALGATSGTLLLMAVAGLLTGIIVDRWASEAKGHGVPEVMEAIALRGGHIRPRVAALKVLASALTIGAGGSAGREGPIVQTGSALGSTLGQALHFSGERVRTLVACGAAAGIAATFNAPIAGAIFALEVVLGRFTVRYFGAVVISSVSAGIVSRALLSNKPAFDVPAYALNHFGEIPIYVLLAMLAALVAVLFIRLLYLTEGLFDDWKIPLPVKASIGMVLTGAVALLLPERQVLGPGLDLIGDTFAGDFRLSLGLLAALLVLKLAATCLTLGSGNSGGVFAPSLFMGAVLGGIVGAAANSLWPGVAVHPGAYAIVGMAAVFAAAARAPITAVLIVFEMSGDYKLILPVMMATVLSTLLADTMVKESIYTFKLKLKGITIQSGRDVDVMQGVKVGEVMNHSTDAVESNISLVELSEIFGRTHAHGTPVLNEHGKLWGIVTVTDMDRAVTERLPRRTPVAEFATPRARLVVAFPDENMAEVLGRMGVRGLGHLPVVDRADPNRLLGMIRRADIIQAYNMAIARRAELQHRASRAEVRNVDGTEFIDLKLEEADRAVGLTLKDLSHELPEDCILISVRRDGATIIPHGDTVFNRDDLITALVRTADVTQLHHCLRGWQAP